MIRPHTLLLASAIILPLTVTLTCCKKKEMPEKPTVQAPTGQPKVPTLADKAGKLGFASKLPLTTEFYFASANLKKHVDALKSSSFGKDIEAIISDKTPAPTAGDKSVSAIKKLWGDDFFVAGARGFGESAMLFREANHLMNEMNFKQIMGGTTGSLASPKSKANPLAMVEAALHDPEQMRRVKQFVAKFELPPLIMGFKADKPAALMKELLPDEMLKKASESGTLTDMTTADGISFKVITFDGAKLVTKQMQDDTLAHLPSDLETDVKVSIEQIFESIQKKKFVIAVGSTDSYVLFACGKSIDHLKFVSEPSDSVLANPEMNWLAPHTEKNLIAIAYANAAVMSAMADDMPITPMIRGVVSAMKENKLFKDTAAKLDKQIGELSTLESAVYSRQATAMVGAAWWDKGLQAETFGGAKPKAFTQTGPLKFARFVEAPGVIFGMSFQRNMDYEKAVRSWMEKVIGMTYSAAKDLVQSGAFGKDSGQQFAMFDQMVLPTALKVYEADRSLNEKGLTGEMGFVLDVNGKMPPLPMMPPETKGTKFPRITTMYDVSDRKQVADSWKTMNDSLSDLNKAMTGGGSGSGGPGLNPAAAADLMSSLQPISSDKNGMTTWFYALPFFSGDLLPCASINDKLLLVSTSKDGAEAFAADVGKPTATKVEGLLWKLDLGALTDFLAGAAVLSPTQTPEQKKEMKQSLRWLKPFRAMRGHTFQENGQLHNTFSWEISDVVSFD